MNIKSHEEHCDGFCSLNECKCSLHDIKQYNAIIEENLSEYFHTIIDPETGEAIYSDDVPF